MQQYRLRSSECMDGIETLFRVDIWNKEWMKRIKRNVKYTNSQFNEISVKITVFFYSFIFFFPFAESV